MLQWKTPGLCWARSLWLQSIKSRGNIQMSRIYGEGSVSRKIRMRLLTEGRLWAPIPVVL